MLSSLSCSVHDYGDEMIEVMYYDETIPKAVLAELEEKGYLDEEKRKKRFKETIEMVAEKRIIRVGGAAWVTNEDGGYTAWNWKEMEGKKNQNKYIKTFDLNGAKAVGKYIDSKSRSGFTPLY